MQLLVAKIGGSVITYKKSKKPRLNKKNIQRVAKEISEAYEEMDSSLIIIHGAGSCGHPIVKRTGIGDGIKNKKQLVDFAETQRLQNKLNCKVTKVLIDNGVPSLPCQASTCAIMKDKKLQKMDTSAIEGFLNIGLVPVLYGVPAYDMNIGCSILSGDVIASYLAAKFDVKRIVFGTDVDGIFTKYPNPDQAPISIINGRNLGEVVKSLLRAKSETDVTGGILGKVLKAGEASLYGTEVVIGNANKPDIFRNLLLGENLGTIIKDVSEKNLDDAQRLLERGDDV